MPDPTPIASDGVNMINAAMAGFNMILGTVLTGLGVRAAREQKAKKSDEEKRDESRTLIKDMATKLDGLCETAAVVTTDLAVVRNDMATVKGQVVELFHQAKEAGQNANTALALIGHRNQNHKDGK